MVSDRGFNPVPLLVHLLAIAAGIVLGLVVMGSISPDLPDPDLGPGVSSSSAPNAVVGDDPDSLFRAANLAPALAQLEDQLGAGEGIRSLHIEPGSVEADQGSGDGLIQPEDVPADLPGLLVSEIDHERGGIELAEIDYMDLVATAKGPRWYVQLDIGREIGPPPWTYGAPLGGTPLSVGPGPPEPLGG